MFWVNLKKYLGISGMDLCWWAEAVGGEKVPVFVCGGFFLTRRRISIFMDFAAKAGGMVYLTSEGEVLYGV